MIFPNDVHKRTVNARKLLAQDKNSIMIQLFFIANIICFFVLRFFFKSFLGLGTGWAIIAQLVLFTVLGIMIFRLVIFKEDEKLQEYQDRESDSFARFLHIRKDNIRQTNIANDNVCVFEYTNGCIMAPLCFKFGSNSDKIANITRHVLEEMFGLICSSNFEFRTITAPEIFNNSQEYKAHLRQINSIKNKKLSLHLRNISQQAIKNTKEYSNTDVLYVFIISKIPGELEQLESLLSQIIRLIRENNTCFRSMEFLDINKLLEFFREFYKIEAIDIAMMKAIELSTVITQDYSNLIKLFSLTSTDGRTYKIGDEPQRFRVDERPLNSIE